VFTGNSKGICHLKTYMHQSYLVTNEFTDQQTISTKNINKNFIESKMKKKIYWKTKRNKKITCISLKVYTF